MTPEEHREIARCFLDMQLRSYRQGVRWGRAFDHRPARETPDEIVAAVGKPSEYADSPLELDERDEAVRQTQIISETGELLHAIVLLHDNWRIKRPDDIAKVWVAATTREVTS